MAPDGTLPSSNTFPNEIAFTDYISLDYGSNKSVRVQIVESAIVASVNAPRSTLVPTVKSVR
mgnify:CR=1 FL=1